MKKETCLGGREVAGRGLDAVAGVQAGPLDASVGGGGHIARGAVPLTAAAGGHPGLVRLLAKHRPDSALVSDSSSALKDS